VTRVLLVTGSRSLAAHPGAEAWARGLIHAALEGVSLLIVGDAPGPDAWAWDVAERHWLIPYEGNRATPATVRRIHLYRTRGSDRGEITAHDGYMRFGRYVLEGAGPWTEDGTTHPLARNAAMVRDAAALARQGCAVAALALLDGTKRDAPGKRATRGTEHTAGLAERAGIAVQREVWNG